MMTSFGNSYMNAVNTHTAASAGLHYVTGHEPGIRRTQSLAGPSYTGPDGLAIEDPDVLERIHHLAIPPAWTNVWIAVEPFAHIQATGQDARGRKQYRYHDLWRSVRDEAKFDRLVPFGEALPVIRQRVDLDLKLSGVPHAKMVAVVVRLLELTLIRVGDDEYARQNQTYGLTTMLGRHLDMQGARIRFHFRGKSGKDHDISLVDKRLARIVRASQHLPGERLFEYLDEHGHFRPVESSDVNQYLHDTTAEELTAKDYRTWGASMIVAIALRSVGGFGSQSEAKKQVLRAIDTAAQHLGNTRSVARQSYVHPAIIEAYLSGKLPEAMSAPQEVISGERLPLEPDEVQLLQLLKRHLVIAHG